MSLQLLVLWIIFFIKLFFAILSILRPKLFYINLFIEISNDFEIKNSFEYEIFKNNIKIHFIVI